MAGLVQKFKQMWTPPEDEFYIILINMVRNKLYEFF